MTEQQEQPQDIVWRKRSEVRGEGSIFKMSKTGHVRKEMIGFLLLSAEGTAI